MGLSKALRSLSKVRHGNAGLQGQSGQLQLKAGHVIVNRMIYRSLIVIAATAILSGCGMLTRLTNPAPPAPVAIAAPPPAAEGMGVGQSAAALDTSTAAEKTAATAAPQVAGERVLGRVVAGLGSPAMQGFWLKSALIVAPGKGRVETADGKTVAVDLVPGTGGALLSLAAFRALGLGLTDLPEVSVYAN